MSNEDKIKINIDDTEMEVLKSTYIKAKTKDLRNFGYVSLTEDQVSIQLEKIIKGETLDVIGMFMKDEIVKDL